MSEPARRSPRRWLVVIVALVLAGLATHGTYAGSGDEPHYLAIAHSIAFDVDLDLSNNYGANEPLIGGGTLEPEAHVRRGVGGVARPVHDVGMPLLFAPYVRGAAPLASHLAAALGPSILRRLRVTPAIIYRHLISLAMIGVTAVLAVLLLQTASDWGQTGVRPGSDPSLTPFWATLVVVLSPPLLIHSILFFTEIPTALLTFAVFRALADERKPAAPPPGAFALGAATGLLVLIHVRSIGVAIPLVAIAGERFVRAKARQSLPAFATGVAVLLAIRTAINHHFWGSWVTNPHAHAGAWAGWGDQIGEAARRLVGMFVDPGYGLLLWAPVFLLVPYGFIVLARTGARFAIRALLVVGCYLAFVACPLLNVHGVSGGWSPAARFLVPVVPILGLAVIAAIVRGPRALVIPLVVIQLGIDAYVWQHPKVLWHADSTIRFIGSL